VNSSLGRAPTARFLMSCNDDARSVKNRPVTPTLSHVVGRSIILAWREDVDQLSTALKDEGLRPEIQRAAYTDEQAIFARNTRTFMNHCEAWKRAACYQDYSLVCESDFVPCAGLGSLPTFWPLENRLAWAYLYQGSPRILAAIGDRPFLRGHAAPLVAYVINATVANILIRFYDYELSKYDPREYFTFDSHLQWFAMGQGAEAYMPLRHYGEHGGLPNPEHGKVGRLPRAGAHRADNLVAPLKFLPSYAHGSRARYLLERSRARIYGLARLLSGRWVVRTNVYDFSLAARFRMYLIGARRLIGA
jgi:hypothetical protein